MKKSLFRQRRPFWAYFSFQSSVPVQTGSGSDRFWFIPVPVHMDYGFRFRFRFTGSRVSWNFVRVNVRAPTPRTRPEWHPRSRGFPSRIKDQWSRIGSRILNQGSKNKDQRSRIEDQRPRIKYQGSRILDQGPCFGMNEHPGRDTDVISSLSKSTTQDLSFYIGFTRMGARIKDLVSWTFFWHEWAF